MSCQIPNEHGGTRFVPGCGARTYTSTDFADRGRGHGDIKHEGNIVDVDRNPYHREQPSIRCIGHAMNPISDDTLTNSLDEYRCEKDAISSGISPPRTAGDASGTASHNLQPSTSCCRSGTASSMRWSSADSSDLQGRDYDDLVGNMYDALFRLACMLSSVRPIGSLAMRCRRMQRGDHSNHVNILSGLPDLRFVTFAWKDNGFVWPWYQTSRST